MDAATTSQLPVRFKQHILVITAGKIPYLNNYAILAQLVITGATDDNESTNTLYGTGNTI